MSRGWGAQQTSRPGPLTQLVYLEDMEVVPTMISTYKACVEPWENHLDGKQVVWSGSRERIDCKNHKAKSHLLQPRERQFVAGYAR